MHPPTRTNCRASAPDATAPGVADADCTPTPLHAAGLTNVVIAGAVAGSMGCGSVNVACISQNSFSWRGSQLWSGSAHRRPLILHEVGHARVGLGWRGHLGQVVAELGELVPARAAPPEHRAALGLLVADERWELALMLQQGLARCMALFRLEARPRRQSLC